MKIGLIVITVLATVNVYGQNKLQEMKSAVNEKSLTCKLTSGELQERKQTVLSALKNQIISKVELENGYQYSFLGSDELIDQLTLFIKTERQCCDFFNYQVEVSGCLEQTYLKITGPAGAKDFIKDELGL